jgi:hypothetical protein
MEDIIMAVGGEQVQSFYICLTLLSEHFLTKFTGYMISISFANYSSISLA